MDDRPADMDIDGALSEATDLPGNSLQRTPRLRGDSGLIVSPREGQGVDFSRARAEKFLAKTLARAGVQRESKAVRVSLSRPVLRRKLSEGWMG